jgi:DNA-nicking Smr family endonuclease
MKRRKFPSPENPRNDDQQQTSPRGWSPKRHQMQDMWQVSCWHEGDNKRVQGLALLKKTEEILSSKNNNRAKKVSTRAQCATTHKMHICRERYNSRIQSKTKTQRESTRMHRAKVAKTCSSQKGANPPKRKVSEQGKDVVCEQQNAPRKFINEYVATKKHGRSRYTREDPSKLPQTRYCECRLYLLGFLRRRATSVLQDVLRACHKTCYKRVTRRATSVQQHSVRACNRRATSV